MNENEARKKLAVFDSLLEDLANAAADPQTLPADFFQQVDRVIKTILSPQQFVVVAAGPRNSLLSIHSTSIQTSNVAELVEVDQHDADSLIAALKPKGDNILVSPIKLATRSWGWIVTVFSNDTDATAAREVLEAIAQIIAEFLTSRQLARQKELQNQFQLYSNNVHASLNPQEVAQHIANDARLLMNCERVSVYFGRPRRPKLFAISTVATVENRSELMKLQQRLVSAAARLNQSIGSDQPPQDAGLNSLLTNYRDVSGFPFLFGMPLEAKDGSVGYLLAESTPEINRIEFAQGLAMVVQPAATALANAEQHHAIPFRNFLSAMGGAASRLQVSKGAIGILGVILAIIALSFFRTDFMVKIQGELRPLEERVVFAPQDGVVEKVLVRHGQQVKPGQLLLQLHSPDLELALTKNAGELERLTQLLDAKNIALNQATSDPNATSSIIGQLSSEVSDVKYEISSAIDEQKYLSEQQNELNVTSPIAGSVTTWKVEELLMNKPVRWGDSLMNVANEAGPWQLRFLVPERRIGYILTAQQEKAGWDLEFFFESNPGQRFATQISEIGKSTEQDKVLGPVAIVFCPAPDGDYVRRHGARVIAKVNCGRKSIAYVWSRELIDSVRRRFVW